MFGIPAVVVLGVGVVVLVASRRFRPVGLAALGTSIVYAVGFREGSFVHDYWNYWLVITLVLGVGAIASLPRADSDRRAWLPVGCVAGSRVGRVRLHGRTREAESANGRRALSASGSRIHAAGAGQRWVPLVSNSLGPPGSTAAWVLPQARFYFRVPLRFATAPSRLVCEAASRRLDRAELGRDGGGELVRGRDALARLAERLLTRASRGPA